MKKTIALLTVCFMLMSSFLAYADTYQGTYQVEEVTPDSKEGSAKMTPENGQFTPQYGETVTCSVVHYNSHSNIEIIIDGTVVERGLSSVANQGFSYTWDGMINGDYASVGTHTIYFHYTDNNTSKYDDSFIVFIKAVPQTPTPTPTPPPTSPVPPLTPTTDVKPVVIVHGIMGSHLYNYTNGVSEHLWVKIPLSKMELIELTLLSLNEYGESSQNVGPIGLDDPNNIKNGFINGIIENTILTGDVYEGIVRRLEATGKYKRGVNLFAVPYDWRMTNKKSIETLSKVIEIAKIKSGWDKVDIVAHSMGGLVTKRYLMTSENQNNIDRFISVGTPYLGAPVGLAKLLWGTGFGLIQDADPLKMLAKNYPSIYELLPSQAYFEYAFANPNGQHSYVQEGDVDLNGNGITNEELSYHEIQRILMDINNNLWTYGNNFHAYIDNKSTGVKQYAIGAKGMPTVSKVIIKDRLLGKGEQYEFNEGDGTVPYISAKDAGNVSVESIALKNVAHGKLLDSDIVIDKIIEILNTSATASANDTTINGTIIVVNSELTPMVTRKNNINQKIGIENDEVVNTFGDSAYIQKMGHSIVMFIPVNGEDLKIDLAGTGLSNIKVKEYEKSEIVKATAFNDFDMGTLGGKALLEYIPTQNQQNIQIDKDNNSIFEQQLLNNLYIGDLAKDNIAPTIKYQISSYKGSSQWHTSPVTIKVISSDVGVGTDISYYKVDEGTVKKYSGSEFTISGNGLTSIKSESIDKLGNIGTIFNYNIKIDTDAPTVKLTQSYDRISNTYYVTIQASDSTSGIFKIEYKLNDGNYTTYINPISITRSYQGTKITYRAIDNAGNRSSEITQIIGTSEPVNIWTPPIVLPVEPPVEE